MPQTPTPLTDDEIISVADDPEMVKKFTSEERRRLTRLQAQKAASSDLTRTPQQAFRQSISDTYGKAMSSIGSGVLSALNPLDYIRTAITGLQAASGDPMAAMSAGQGVIDTAKGIASGDPEIGGRMIGQLATGLVAPRMMANTSIPESAVNLWNRTEFHPSGILDLNLKKPLSVLRKVVTIAPSESPAPTGPMPRIAGKSPSVEDALNSALQDILNEKQATTTSTPPPPSQTAAGKPSVTAQRYDQMTQGQSASRAPMPKSAKMAETDVGADKLSALLDAIHGEDRPTVGNGVLPANTPRPTAPPQSIRLTPAEVQMKNSLMKQGYSETDVIRAIVAQRLKQSPSFVKLP